MTDPVSNVTANDLLGRLLREKRTAEEFQERRHEDWDSNYLLYRNKVFVNRLTQRQAVNIPLMKETVKTLLSKIDEPPNVDWKELGGNLQKEIILQELWNDDSEENDFDGIDAQDKKNVLLFGRSFKKLNLADGCVDVRVLDVYDVIVDPLTDPLDIETARFVIHRNIFRSLREIIASDRYTEEGKNALKNAILSPEGIVQTGKAKEELEKKQERLKAMGVTSEEFAHFAGGDVVVNISEHYTSEWDVKEKKFVRRVVTYANESVVLSNDKLIDLIGVEFWPFVTWGEDVETTDFWCDGPADLVRVPNQVVNVWFSQLVENRTLRNFQMHWYDATKEGYQPQTYEPGSGRMLPAPGNPKDVIMPVQVEGLDETMNSIEFIIKLVERGTSATAIEKGVSERKSITLGEVQTLVGKAMERTLAMAKFYRRSWKDLAMKWYRLMDANDGRKRTLYRESSSGKVWPKTVYPNDWKSKEGFRATVSSSSEQEEDKLKSIQKFMFLLQQFPNNAALRRIAQKRMLESANLTVQEMQEIAEEEERMQKQQEELARQQQEMQAVASQAAQGQQPQIVGPSPLQGAAQDVTDMADEQVLEDKLAEFSAMANGTDMESQFNNLIQQA